MSKKQTSTTDPWGESEDRPAPAVSAPSARKMPARVETVEMEGDYEGWTFQANKNYTLGELEALCSGYYYRMRDTLRALVTGWNFVDREGAELSFDDAGWDALGVDLVGEMARATVGLTRVPKA